MSKHTPEPWRTCLGMTTDDLQPFFVARCAVEIGVVAKEKVRGDEPRANAYRIFDCVNACEGINPKAVPEMLRVLKTVRDCLDDYLGDEDGVHPDVKEQINSVIAEAEKGDAS